MSILAPMPPKASSASSPCSAAPTQYSTMPTQPRLSSTPRPLILLLPRRTERNTRPGEPGAREQVGPTVTRKDACPCRRSAKRRPPRFGTEWKTHRARREGNWAGQAPPLSRARAGLASPPKPRCGVPSRSRPAQGLALCCVRRTPGISCEAVPAFEVGRRGHEAACPFWQPCRRKLRQLHPLVRPLATSLPSLRRAVQRQPTRIAAPYAKGPTNVCSIHAGVRTYS